VARSALCLVSRWTDRKNLDAERRLNGVSGSKQSLVTRQSFTTVNGISASQNGAAPNTTLVTYDNMNFFIIEHRGVGNGISPSAPTNSRDEAESFETVFVVCKTHAFSRKTNLRGCNAFYVAFFIEPLKVTAGTKSSNVPNT
jgi:hypothetical protein